MLKKKTMKGLLSHIIGFRDDEVAARSQGHSERPATDISPVFHLHLLILQTHPPDPAIAAPSIEEAASLVVGQVLRAREAPLAYALAGSEDAVVALRHGQGGAEGVVCRQRRRVEAVGIVNDDGDHNRHKYEEESSNNRPGRPPASSVGSGSSWRRI